MNLNLAQKFASKMKQLAQSQLNPSESSYQSPSSRNQPLKNSIPQQEEQKFSDIDNFNEISDKNQSESEINDMNSAKTSVLKKPIALGKKNSEVARKSAPKNIPKIFHQEPVEIKQKNVSEQLRSKISSYNPTKIAINIRLQNMPNSVRVLQSNKKQTEKKKFEENKKKNFDSQDFDNFEEISDSENEKSRYDEEEQQEFEMPVRSNKSDKKLKNNVTGSTNRIQMCTNVIEEQKKKLEEEKILIQREKKMIQNQRRKMENERKREEEEKKKVKKRQQHKEKQRNNNFNQDQIQLIKNICQESVFEKMEVMIDKITNKLKVNTQTAIRAANEYDQQRRFPSKKRCINYEQQDNSGQYVSSQEKYKKSHELREKGNEENDYLSQRSFEQTSLQKSQLRQKKAKKQSHEQKLDRILKEVTRKVNIFLEKSTKKSTPNDQLKKLLVNEALDIIQSFEDLIEDDKQEIMDRWIDQKKKEQKKNNLRKKYVL